MFLLADDVLIDGVGCGEAKDESSNRNHDNTVDYQAMPAVIERPMIKKISIKERS